MSYFVDDSDRALMTQSDDIRVLGETGKTVVYMFPDGRALAEREQPDFESLSNHSQASPDQPLQLLENLLETGKITPAQKAVVLHDQEMTGMEIEEILTARGWF